MLPTTQPVVPPQMTSAGLMTKAISLLDELTKYIVALESRNASLSAQLVMASAKAITVAQNAAIAVPAPAVVAPVPSMIVHEPNPPSTFVTEHPITHTPPNHPEHTDKK